MEKSLGRFCFFDVWMGYWVWDLRPLWFSCDSAAQDEDEVLWRHTHLNLKCKFLHGSKLPWANFFVQWGLQCLLFIIFVSFKWISTWCVVPSEHWKKITWFPNHRYYYFSSNCDKESSGGLLYTLYIAPLGNKSKFLGVILA